MTARRLTPLLVLLLLMPLLPLIQVGPAAAQSVTGPGDQPRLRLTGMSPRVVTELTQSVMVSGEITNTTRGPLDEVVVRLRRAAKLTSTDRLLSTVANPPRNVSVNTGFIPVTNHLPPGGSATFQITVPVTGADSLQITERGVYQVLVNVNGRSGQTAATRLAETGLLLPVLPPAPGAVTAPDPATALTVLWPIADRPRLIPGIGERARLTDDDLTDSLSPGGRLFGLLEALEHIPADAVLNSALCLAVDPDLVETVTTMTRPYEVWSASGVVAGRGGDAATQWLDKLKTVATGRCVIALPVAGTDLVAASRAGLNDLVELALGRDRVIQEAIGAQPMPTVVWPRNGLLDNPVLTELTRLGTRAVILDPRTLANHDSAETATLARDGGDGPLAVKTDPLLTDLLSPMNSPTGLATQNAIGALAFRAGVQHDQPPPGGTAVIAPPTGWSVPTTELTAFLDAVRYLLGAGHARPRHLTQLVADVPRSVPVSTAYPVTAGAAEIPGEVTARVHADRAVLNDLGAAMHTEHAKGVDPPTVLEPYRLGLLRAMSTHPAADVNRAAFSHETVHNAVNDLLARVKVVQPGTVYSLASSDSPLPLTVSNDLPVAIDVRVDLDVARGLLVKPIPVKTIPAQGTLSLLLPAEVVRSGSFTVNASVSTPGGTPLGPGSPSHLQLRSTAYGTVTLVLTIVAFLVLVGLSLFRLVRRFRSGGRRSAEADPSEADCPRGDPPVTVAGADPPVPADKAATGADEPDHPASPGRAKLSAPRDETDDPDRTPV